MGKGKLALEKTVARFALFYTARVVPRAYEIPDGSDKFNSKVKTFSN